MRNEATFIQKICNYSGYTIEQIKGESKNRKIAMFRHLGMYFLVEKNQLTQQEIAEIFGRTNHAIVIWARDKIRPIVETGTSKIARHYEQLKQILES